MKSGIKLVVGVVLAAFAVMAVSRKLFRGDNHRSLSTHTHSIRTVMNPRLFFRINLAFTLLMIAMVLVMIFSYIIK